MSRQVVRRGVRSSTESVKDDPRPEITQGEHHEGRGFSSDGSIVASANVPSELRPTGGGRAGAIATGGAVNSP